MKTPLKLAAFAAALAAICAVAFAVGGAVGPIGAVESTDATDHDAVSGHGASDATHDDASDASGHGDHGVAQPGGLMVSEHGYTLKLDTAILASGTTPVTFRIVGPDGQPVTDYVENHDKDLHFIAVRSDTTGFQHVHPTLSADGAWSAELDLTPGVWRFFADFWPTGHDEAMTLGIDASVAGAFDPQPLPAVARSAETGNYTVSIDGELVPGEASALTLTISRDGEPVTDLQPYLSAYGHLVALRAGDLAYLHVHPEGEPGDGTTQPGPDITFVATAPSAGAYRLFLDFQHDDVVHTAEFTVTTAGSSPIGEPTESTESTKPAETGTEPDGHGDHDH